MRVLRVVRDGGADALLALAIRGLPEDRGDWGRAMLAELGGVQGLSARRRFALGCTRTALGMRLRASLTAPDRGGAGIRALTLAAVVSTLALAVFGLARYPGLRTDLGAWASLGFLLLVLVAYAFAALTLSRGETAGATCARRYGLAGGLTTGAAWLLILAPAAIGKGLVAVPLAVALLGPAVVAILAGRAGRDRRVATAAALWNGLVGGLLVFIVWATSTYADDGRPYDAQLLRDFHKSGSHDLAAYAVGDNLGSALGLLVVIPVVALALGSLSARVVTARPR